MFLIYIPLCLYLYSSPPPVTVLIVDIYIPLCLYLYWLDLPTVCSHTCIYIPLCLYLYLSDRKFQKSSWDLHSTMFIFILLSWLHSMIGCLIFTFHYVYIYMFCKMWSSGIVCIYIPLCLYLYLLRHTFATSFIYLHSTMFIFISVSIYDNQTGEILFTFHYIYIYITKFNNYVNFVLQFTFHYVYIYIQAFAWLSGN